ncbi:hypothetical protein VCEM1676A_003075 [Vibrio cholerae O1 str. EM-1676A]|nr:hypothetical protein VCEM1676A_003075 [Vibrio cholerae O1 str. EM-1676A]
MTLKLLNIQHFLPRKYPIETQRSIRIFSKHETKFSEQLSLDFDDSCL